MRLTFEMVRKYAYDKGVIVEKVGRVYEFYAKNDHSIKGECFTLNEVWDELPDFIKKPASL